MPKLRKYNNQYHRAYASAMRLISRESCINHQYNANNIETSNESHALANNIHQQIAVNNNQSGNDFEYENTNNIVGNCSIYHKYVRYINKKFHIRWI